ncbi:ABC transporter substrate-binding protein [Methylocapsa palsarum]|uniref:NitT/TauT family transport system substrate-binding protein n=1 Tax=Methylocapsa palsarum TaxID=1612308 RepID=A0A1I3W9U6_9HYPH|nr:ABC transporter substrate-binding protein [Methylocapsa palsarum]SFK04338.1 NitT/TauT family transport system substrate-binding protein [Methylocapsa palsarum]
MYPETMPQDNPNSQRINPNAGRRVAAGLGALSQFGRALRLARGAALGLTMALSGNADAHAADKLRVAAQKTGTLAWELGLIKSRGLDKAADLEIEVTELASPEAAKIALAGDAVDVILTDWLWVARERSLGAKLVFAPYSTALGAVMVPANSPVLSLADLKGKTISVAGGPLDKSWLLLQALAKASTFDLKSIAHVIYGAPALLYQKSLNGEADASLNFWTYCASLESRGFRRLIAMDEVETRLGAKDRVAMVGYVFSEGFAQRAPNALERFFKIANEARETLVGSDADWVEIGRKAGVETAAELALYRRTYVEGIPNRSIDAEFADASALYRILFKAGGADLVGPAAELDPAIYYRGASGKRAPEH